MFIYIDMHTHILQPVRLSFTGAWLPKGRVRRKDNYINIYVYICKICVYMYIHPYMCISILTHTPLSQVTGFQKAECAARTTI